MRRECRNLRSVKGSDDATTSGGQASRAHRLRSMFLCVLPPDEGTREQVLPPGQGGIVVSCDDSCAQFRPCLHSVRRREHSTSLCEIVYPTTHAPVGVLFPLRALPLPDADTVQLPLFVPLGVDIRPAQRAAASAPRAPPLLRIDAVRILSVAVPPDVNVRPAQRAAASAPRAPPLLAVGAVRLLSVAVPSGVDVRPAQRAVVSAPRAPLLLAVGAVRLLSVAVPLGVDVRPAQRAVVSAPRVPPPRPAAVSAPVLLVVVPLGGDVRPGQPAVVPAPCALRPLAVVAVQLPLVAPLGVDIRLLVVSALRAGIPRVSTAPPRGPFRLAAPSRSRSPCEVSYARSNSRSQEPTPSYS